METFGECLRNPNKTLTKTINLFATLTTAASALAGPVAFHSESSGTFAILSDPSLPIFQVGIEHSIVSATPFAFQTLEAEQTVDLTGPPAIIGSFTLGDSAGNTLLGSYFASLMFLGPVESVATGTFSFTGGTGLFAGASGDGTIRATIHLGNSNSEITLDAPLTVPDSASALGLLSIGLGGLVVMRRGSHR